jgi:hypothetical protein
VTILSLVGKNGQMSESTNASNTGCADKIRLCLFIARRNGHTAVGDYVEVECKNESLQLVPNCKHVQMPSDTCSCCAAATHGMVLKGIVLTDSGSTNDPCWVLGFLGDEGCLPLPEL